ncbi:hypothetical protein MNEG_10453 [Monoraphidium neglectum]|uniref:Uncharacterized protein n=1 Tax=Monoraphidium neglectum TaxID=145388 RepID=A0A0D2M8Z9_9CHLO|nr:hypothetical protein MNEG_10453 [Monoraphidium neglectum]KIY97511.1 hypothetical protein MNEG_10453 [Monoraphidium neglectum]|eukprot:XP_013896531.1 hypothetical protein MNEG_10453 [Monoraphidium neglectum]
MGARGKGRPREPGTALGCCCGSIPWVQLLCTLLITAGLVVFFLKSGEAFSSVKALFTDLKVSASAQKVAAAAMEGLLAAGIAVVVAAIVLSVVGLVNSWIGNARRYRAKHGARVTDAASCGSWCQMGTSVLVVLLMWLTLALVVALIAAWTAVLLGSISGDSGAGFAMGQAL